MNSERKIEKSGEEWRKILTRDQFRILREKGTEQPFAGKYVHHKKKGVYVCAGCGNQLFLSDTKFDSGTGWPGFWAPVSESSLELRPDTSLGMRRTEVLCSQCGGHLGHVFDDGPQPTGQRFCINSVALNFKAQKSST
jgi:peptide-methionine (R)-S-oxide reductase